MMQVRGGLTGPRVAGTLLVIVCSVAGVALADPCPDADSDAYADCLVPGCDVGSLVCGDCDDADATVHPGAPDPCNGLDDDCDGRIDEESPRVQVTRSVLPEAGDSYPQFGLSVAGVGDVSGDGVADFIVGAPEYDDRDGHAFVYSGADLSLLCDLDDSDGVTTINYDRFGRGVAGIGDVTGDGVPDIAVGSPELNTVTIFSGQGCGFVRELSDDTEPHHEELGWSVAAIGDVDGDDVPDLAAGAPGVDGGLVVVFSGADGTTLYKSLDAASNFLGRLGTSVSGVGDVTGDGVPDFAAGAPYDKNPLGGTTGSFSIFSGADGSHVRRVYDPFGVSSDWFGRSLVGVGDVTGDGWPEIAVGSPAADVEEYGSAHGAVSIFQGKDGSFFRRLIDPERPNDAHFGHSIAPLGDITGDGLTELVIGAPAHSGGQMSRILIVNIIGNYVLRTLEDPVGGFESRLGMAVAVLPDLDGDGFPEVLAGATHAVTPQPGVVGKALVFTLETDCDGDGIGPQGGDCDDGNAAIAPWRLEVCNAIDDDCDGNIDEDDDGDGYAACDDCAAGHPLIHPGAAERCNGIDDDCDGDVDEGADADADGYTFPCDCADADPEIHPGAVESCDHVDNDCDVVVDEPAPRLNGASFVLDPEGEERDEFGVSVAGLGDVTGDGVPDFAVGSYKDVDRKGGAGAVVVFSGADLSPVCVATDRTADHVDQLGSAVLGLDDVTGDGVPDFAAGAHMADHVGNDRGGQVITFSGADCVALRTTWDTETEPNYLGHSLAPMGDFDGDGIADFLASGGGAARVVLGNGALHVFHDGEGGATSLLADPYARIPARPDDSVAAVDDLTGDGVTDILLGIPFDSRWEDEAGVVVLFSGSDGRLVRRFHDPEPTAEAHFGMAVTAIDDLNGDGVPDIVVGAPGYLRQGAVVVLSGSDGSMIRRYSNAQSGLCGFGYSVLTSPDLTGDGVPEILAGMAADLYGGSNCDEAVLVLDGSSGQVLNRFESPATPYDGFARSIALIGDLSGDGVEEIVAGAPSYRHELMYDHGAAFVVGSQSDCDEDGYTLFMGDCADEDPEVHPGRLDLCGDGLDDDCVAGDGTGESWYGIPCDGADRDQCEDGALVCEQGAEACDDDLAASVEVCSGEDDDCDGEVDNLVCADYHVGGAFRIYGTELSQMGRAFGYCSADPQGEWWGGVDYNGDGCVEGNDLAILANLWGLVCVGEVIPCP